MFRRVVALFVLLSSASFAFAETDVVVAFGGHVIDYEGVSSHEVALSRVIGDDWHFETGVAAFDLDGDHQETMFRASWRRRRSGLPFLWQGTYSIGFAHACIEGDYGVCADAGYTYESGAFTWYGMTRVYLGRESFVPGFVGAFSWRW